MKKYVIKIPVAVSICVDAEDEDEALVAANREICSKLQGCSTYCVGIGEVIAEL